MFKMKWESIVTSMSGRSLHVHGWRTKSGVILFKVNIILKQKKNSHYKKKETRSESNQQLCTHGLMVICTILQVSTVCTRQS